MFIDFEYAGQRLSDFGCMVCHITDSGGVETVSIGGQLSFQTIQLNSLNKFKLMSTQYSEAYTATFQIGRYESPYDPALSEYEVRSLMKWLNRRQYHRFRPIHRDGQYVGVYYNGAFQVQLIRLNGDVIGMELTLQTDAPFGYYGPLDYHFDVTEGDNQFSIYDNSDETGYIYPHMVTIQCQKDGKLEITNSMDSQRVVIDHCTAGETLTMDGEHKIITSSLSSHTTLCNDFNYRFLRIHNEYEDSENVFTASLPCSIDLSYSSICKAGGIG